jgi:hypothetical protein
VYGLRTSFSKCRSRTERLSTGLRRGVPADFLKYLGKTVTGTIRWHLTGDPGRTYQVEGSVDLVDWISIASIVPVTGAAEFNDAGVGDLRFRFYRAALMP